MRWDQKLGQNWSIRSTVGYALPRRGRLRPDYRHREVDPIEVLMESLFDSLSTLEFHPCLRDAGIAREAF